jgi:hypothetical protein
MHTKLIPDNIARVQFFCLSLIIGLIFTINSAQAQDANTDFRLKVVGGTQGVQLDYPIWVQIENLEKWAAQPAHDTSKFALCIDGNEFKGMPQPLVRGDLLGFQVRPSSESKDAWKNIISPPSIKNGAEVLVSVRHSSVKVEGTNKAFVIVINPFWFKIFLVSVAAALILFWWLAYKSDIIREPGGQPKGTDKYGKVNRKAYSLGRTQMACWFFVVAISFVYLWMLTHDLASLTPSVLALIGISAATGLASATVDSSKRNNQENLRRSLEEKKKQDEAEAERLRSEISTLNTPVNATPVSTNLEQHRAAMVVKQGDLAAKEMEIKQSNRQIQEVREKEEPVPSKGFINDVLGDQEGVSFHRFQMFVWTIVLAVIFIRSVYDVLTMPDFDTTLLALLGISGGTYIGFKLPNQQG